MELSKYIRTVENMAKQAGSVVTQNDVATLKTLVQYPRTQVVIGG